MAHEDFENIVKSRFQGFESAPPESVWSGVNAIRAQRRKRIFWWLLPLLLITVGASAFYAINYISTAEAKNTLNSINTITKNTQVAEIKYTTETKTDISTNTTDAYSSHHSSGRSKIKKTITQKPTSNNSANNPMLLSTEENEDERIASLPAMQSLPIQIPSTEWELQQPGFEGNSRQPRHHWRHSIGLNLGSFVSISEARADYAQSITLFAEDASYGNATYQRFLEAAPYIEWKNTLTGFSLRGNLVYSAANISSTTNADTFLGRQQSYGVGIGSGYAFVRRRFEAALYVQLQSEIINTLYSSNENYPWFADTNSGQLPSAQTNANPPAPPSYNQLALSGEIGLRGSFTLRNPYWRLNFGAGYRNYFWQQKKAMPANEAILVLPQLLHLNAGISYMF